MCRDDVATYGNCLVDGPNFVIYYIIIPAYLTVSLFSFLFIYFRWLSTHSPNRRVAQLFQSMSIALSISLLLVFTIFHLSTKNNLEESKAYLQKEFSKLDATVVPDAIVGAFDVCSPEKTKFPLYFFYFFNELFFANVEFNLDRIVLGYMNATTYKESMGGWSLGYQIHHAERSQKIQYVFLNVAKKWRALQPLRRNPIISICEAVHSILSVDFLKGDEEIAKIADQKMSVYMQGTNDRYKSQIRDCLKR